MAAGRKRIHDKRDRLRQLRAFCRAAQRLSITRGAEDLGLSQPAVSSHVRELQHELEAVLFERNGQQLSLTPAGETLYEIAMPLVRAMDDMPDELVRGLAEEVSGRVRIAAGTSFAIFVLPPLLERFRNAYPGFSLRVRHALPDEGLKLLGAGEVDLAIGPRGSTGDDVLYHPIFSYDHQLVVSREHPLAGRESVELEEALAWPAIVPPRGVYDRQNGESIGQRFVAQARVAVEVRGWDVIKAYAAAGFGVAVVPSHCIAEGDPVAAIPFAGDARPLSYGVFIPSDAPLAPPVERFIAMMVPDFVPLPASA